MFQVAVCDDEAVFLDRTVQILHDAFGEMPHAIQTFQTAGAALSAIGETDYRPDIAVLDIRLADADGIALAKQINRSVPACRIIFLSSYTGYLMDAYEAEHVYYVLKPDMAASSIGVLMHSLRLKDGGKKERRFPWKKKS